MKINQRQLAQTLRESATAPNAPGPIRHMMAADDVRYLMQRAVELATLAIGSPTPDQKSNYLKQAITLLGVARHEVNKNCTPIKTVVSKHTSGGPEIRGDI